MPLYMLALWRLSRRVDHSSFNLSCNLIGQRENKSRYVTEIVLPFGYADVIRDFKHRRRERQRRRDIVRENPNATLRMSGGKYPDVLFRGPT